VPGDVSLWPNLTGGEVIDLLGRLRGGLDQTRRDDLIERFHLDPTKNGRTYSKGNRQKVALVAALASDVDLYILDEPTAGLDPIMEHTFRECVAEVAAKGSTVLLSSHILRHLTRTTITATLARPLALDELTGTVGVHDGAVDGTTVSVSVDGQHLGSVLDLLGKHGIQTLTSQPPTLEELFLRSYGR
jgi:ABC-2 type transport system ATP-binding protein